MSIKLGELLVKAKVINEQQLKAALEEQKKWGGRLGDILVRMTFITEDLLVKALAKQLNIPRVDLDALEPVPKAVIDRIPHDLARDLQAVALQLKDDGKTLVVAMAEPQNLNQIDTLSSVSRCKIQPAIASATQIARMIARSYGDEAGESFGSDDGDTGFKVVDAQGKTVVKNLADLKKRAEEAVKPAARPPPSPAASAQPSAPSSPGQLLSSLEEAQRREVAALKAMVELLIEKGVFSREEYLARVRR